MAKLVYISIRIFVFIVEPIVYYLSKCRCSSSVCVRTTILRCISKFLNL